MSMMICSSSMLHDVLGQPGPVGEKCFLGAGVDEELLIGVPLDEALPGGAGLLCAERGPPPDRAPGAEMGLSVEVAFTARNVAVEDRAAVGDLLGDALDLARLRRCCPPSFRPPDPLSRLPHEATKNRPPMAIATAAMAMKMADGTRWRVSVGRRAWVSGRGGVVGKGGVVREGGRGQPQQVLTGCQVRFGDRGRTLPSIARVITPWTVRAEARSWISSSIKESSSSRSSESLRQ